MMRVIFDTDIGIDDAMALLFLHYATDVDLLAIVTGFGNASVETTTRNALFIKQKFNIAAPVYQGAQTSIGPVPLSGYPDFVHGANGLGDIDIVAPTVEKEKSHGAQAIVDLVQQHPGEIYIVAVGRMTNLALALELCPQLPELVKQVVVMGGAFGFNGHRGNVSPVAEANVAGDPTAADLVFSSGMPITVVGLDVTQEVIMTDAFFASLKQTAGESGVFVYDISRYYLNFHLESEGKYQCPVHDSSAVAYLLRPDLFSSQDAVVRVVTEGIAMGQTINSPPGSTWAVDHWDTTRVCRICTDVKSEEVLKLYSDTLSRE